MFTRLEVEGGFLHGLDLSLSPGLNVLIGARGTGKTSVIELIRYCLGVPAYTRSVERRVTDHARSVLEGGEVRLTYQHDDGAEHRVVRRAGDDAPHRPDSSRERRAIVLAQTEIERVGLDKRGRLSLIDDFILELSSLRQHEERLISAISSITRQISDVVSAIQTVQAQIARASEVEHELQLMKEGTAEAPADAEIARVQAKLRVVDDNAAIARERLRVLDRVRLQVQRWREAIDVISTQAPTEAAWPDADAVGLTFDTTVGDIAEATEYLRGAQLATDRSIERLSAGVSDSRAAQEAADEQARVLRSDLERRQEGAGRQAQLISRIAQSRSEIASARAVLDARTAEALTLQAERSRLLDEVQLLRSERFDARCEAANMLNQRLGPAVHIEVQRLGLYDEYAGAIATTLRGSGIQYTKLAGEIAERMTPRELCDAVEVGDAETIASAAAITEERAGRLIDALREAGTQDIIVAPVDDSVDLFLLDGADYKRTDELSTGQRCTIVLPILLCHTDVTILIDQPEDHLDNAFIVETVVKTIRERTPSAQFVFATHNANIPVLGEADRVNLLASDGRRGFIRSSGPLEEAATREAVTNVMEGGRAAFARRAAFYRRGS